MVIGRKLKVGHKNTLLWYYMMYHLPGNVWVIQFLRLEIYHEMKFYHVKNLCVFQLTLISVASSV